MHRLHYTEFGRTKSPRVVVCAHGYSGNSRDFDFLARSLATGARVICVDIAGRGESDWLASPFSYHFGQFLSDINELVSHLGVKQVDWVGTSMGGLLGMLLASQPASPVRRLVMNDIGAFVPMDALSAIGRNLQAPERFASLGEVEEHMRRTHRDWGEITPAQWKHIALHGSRRLDGGGYRLHFDPAIARLLAPMPFTPGVLLWNAWYRVSCEVLLLRGEHSEVFPRDVADTMLDVKPGTQLAEIPGCGHAPSLMASSQIAIVRNFLEAPADKAQWRPRSSSFPASSRTRTPSSTRSGVSGRSRPAASPT
ncbi:MAG: alpha/beta fold hydrolase [Usitatibacter sp.]